MQTQTNTYAHAMLGHSIPALQQPGHAGAFNPSFTAEMTSQVRFHAHATRPLLARTSCTSSWPPGFLESPSLVPRRSISADPLQVLRIAQAEFNPKCKKIWGLPAHRASVASQKISSGGRSPQESLRETIGKSKRVTESTARTTSKTQPNRQRIPRETCL